MRCLSVLLLLCAACVNGQTLADTGSASYVLVDPDTLPANGIAQSIVTVYLGHAGGSGIAGATVTLDGNNVQLFQPASPTDANGFAYGQAQDLMPGTRTISASVTSGALTIAISKSAQLFLYTGDANGALPSGAPLIFTAVAHDAHGQVDLGYTGTMRFESSDPNATVPADYAFTASDAGMHVFDANSVVLRTAGVQTITAIDVGSGWTMNTRSYTIGGES